MIDGREGPERNGSQRVQERFRVIPNPASGVEEEEESGRNGERSGSTVVEESVSVVDSLFDYVAAKFRLERYRYERQIHILVWRLLFVVAGGAIAMMGLVFVAVGAAELISLNAGWPPAGPLIVGGFCLLGGAIGVGMAHRRRARP